MEDEPGGAVRMRYRLFNSFVLNPVDDAPADSDPAVTAAVAAATTPAVFGTPAVFAPPDPISPGPDSDLSSITTAWLGPVPTQASGPVPPLSGTQKTDDNSDLAMGGPTARSTYNVTGATLSTGPTLRIGIMSDSFDKVAPESGPTDPVAIDQADGDLPSGANLVVVQDDPDSGGTDEGRSMAELVHRVAPGAQIYFYSADGSQSDFATGINTLAADGCQIIVDDVDYFAEPIFQNGGIVQTAVNNAVADGVNYFTSVTNNGTDYYEANFNPMSFNLPGVGTEITHNVSGGFPYETMMLQPGTTFIDLQWGQPFASIAGGAGASYGIGVAVYNDPSGTPSFAFNVDSLGTGQDPVNIISIDNSGGSAINIAFAFYIDAGTLPTTNTSETTLFEAIAVNTNSQFTGTGHGVGTGDSIGHNQQPGANTVGAIDYAKTPAFGVTPPVQETFSSHGPGEWLYNSSGALLTTPQVLGAPNISAPDGSVTSVPEFTSGFFGTSAAAPDAAGVTALMLQEDGRLTTKQVSYILEATAISTGNSVNGGAGLVQAPGAVGGANIAITDPLWTGLGGNSLWSNAANWSDDAVPGSGALVVLGNGDGAVTAAYTATFNSALANVGMLTIDGSGGFDPETPSLTIDANDTLDATSVLLGSFGALDISGDLTISGALGTGAESVTAGAVTTSPANGPSGINLESSGLLTVGAGDTDGIAFVGKGATLTFMSSDSTVLTTDITGPVTGFTKGDLIDFSGLTWQSDLSVKVSGGIATIFDTTAPSVALANIPVSGTFGSLSVQQDKGTGTELVACFAAGTRIATPDGSVAVEALRIGDLVTTVDGAARPVRWIGHRGIDLERHADRARAEPIRIRKDAVVAGLPSRDLLISPDHALFLEGALVPARLLVNGTSIARETAARRVVYYHVELDNHDVLYAEGLPVESYLDTGNRSMFENGGGAMRLHPDFSESAAAWEAGACAPLLTAPNAVARIRRGLAERAEALGLRMAG
jgi:hypothetical protein